MMNPPIRTSSPVRTRARVERLCSRGMVAPKIALTEAPCPMGTVQMPVPEQAPVQPAKTEPGSATAVSITVPLPPKVAAHDCPQERPAGDEVTVPEPPPDL